MFKTVRDFLIRFEVILDYFRVDIENDCQSSDFKTSKWKHIRELLISKFGQIITYKDYREELFKCRQLNGEYLHTYMDRYIDLIVEAEFEDTVFLVHCFLHLLLDPVRECVIKKLAAIRKEEETASNGCYTTVYDTLAQVQQIATIASQATNANGLIENNTKEFFAQKSADILGWSLIGGKLIRDLRFHVATDTSATVIVGILYQIINVAMIPRKVSPLERNYSTTKRPIHSKNFRDLVTSACTNTIEGTGNGIKMHVPYSHRTERSMPWKLVEFIWRRKHSGNYWER
ncbi:hypothetical protein G6F70_002035 [Rhizopus microsporus]|nr:hypothetical protein G6F71_004613 [Rhizopus microsporus]KAG1202710.1 hypothetical protein G6F70_002035 [Rhizopus microsporus]KAG1211580.1 hypothetical protein G6F69_004465 [Rhizopus microsporus]KAG1238708.1 hypothetical protein G6F67_000183 [Rhizopus microsporus]KAG1260760.1 hypothetical protein G6F68_007188 [Rhizopus microsporus]